MINSPAPTHPASASVESVAGQLVLRLQAEGKLAVFNLTHFAIQDREAYQVTEAIRALVEEHLRKIPGWEEGKPPRIELELGTDRDPPGFGKFWEFITTLNFYRDPRRFSMAVWRGALDWWRGQPPGIREPDMGWLFEHCRAIGMTQKSESGTMRDDIGLFTIEQKAEIERLKREREDWPGERLRKVFRERLHAYLDQVKGLLIAGDVIDEIFQGYEKEVEAALQIPTEKEREQAARPMPVDVEAIVVAALFDFIAFICLQRKPVMIGKDYPSTEIIQLLLEWAQGKIQVVRPSVDLNGWVRLMREASGHPIAPELVQGDPVEALAGLLMRQKYEDPLNPRTWGEARDVARGFLNQQSLVRVEMPAPSPNAN